MFLKTGISGYFFSEDSVLTVTDFNEFKASCHYIGVQYGEPVLGFREAYRSGFPNNYHLAWLGYKNDVSQTIIFFLNAHHPFMAMALGQRDDKDALPQYGEWQSAAQLFEGVTDYSIPFASYQLLEPEVLKELLSFRFDHKSGNRSLDNPNELGVPEVAAIHSWHKSLGKPITVGDVIFNWWD